jgi:POT family proton-dependent oligopeptide transporter
LLRTVQPKGLAILAGTAVWNNFSFFGTSTLLLLFLQDQLLVAGHRERVLGFASLRSLLEAITGEMDDAAFAAQIVGLFVGLVYLTPLPGGLLADRVLGRSRAVVLGAALMLCAHLMLAFEPVFLIGLALLAIGSGLFEPSLAAQVGDLYPSGDTRRDRGFYLYYASINLGAFAAPFAVGTVGELVGWHYGFALAAGGMAIALVVHRLGRDWLPKASAATTYVEASHQQGEGRSLRWLLIVALVLVGFRVVYWQQATVFVFWARDLTDRHVGGFEIPVTWFQSLSPFFVIALGPVLLLLWSRQARRGSEPSPLGKMMIGCMLLCVANAALGLVALTLAGNSAGWIWCVFYFLALTAGELFTLPIGLSLFATAPARYRARMIGVWYVISSAGGVLGGACSGLWSSLGPAFFWFLMAAIATATCIALFLVSRWPFAARAKFSPIENVS